MVMKSPLLNKTETYFYTSLCKKKGKPGGNPGNQSPVNLASDTDKHVTIPKANFQTFVTKKENGV
jgi:hypothetical protein